MSHIVHSCRFTDWKPNSISSVAFNKAGTRLAVARANGDMELWALRAGNGAVKESTPTISIRSSKEEIEAYIKNAINRSSKSTFAASTQWYCENTIPGNGTPNITGVFWAIRSSVELSTAFSSTTEKEKIIDRLMTIGINGKIVEWDIETGLPKTVSDSYGGAIWAGALSPSTTQLIIGCEDGTLRLFDISDPSSPPNYLKAFYRHRGRVLSVDWLQNPAFYSNTSARTVRPDGSALTKADDPPLVVSGGVDGLIRTWNIVSNRNLAQISIDSLRIDPTKKDLYDDASNPNNGIDAAKNDDFSDDDDDDEGSESDASEDDTDLFGNKTSGGASGKKSNNRKRTGRKLKRSRVWAVKFIDAQTIVSGDSLGKVQVYETRFGTLIKAFHLHKADVMCLSVVPPLSSLMRQTRSGETPQPPNVSVATHLDFPTIFASGVDSKVIQLQAAPSSDENVVGGETVRYAHQLHWAHTGSQRIHTHDVISMTVSPAMFAIDHTAIAEEARRAILSSASLPEVENQPSSETENENLRASQLASRVYSQIMEVPRKFEVLLVTGSIDTQAVIYSCSRFAQITPRKISPFPHRPVMSFTQYSITPARGNEVITSLYRSYPNAGYLQPLTSELNEIAFREQSGALPLVEASATKDLVLVEAPARARALLFTNKIVQIYSLGSAQNAPKGSTISTEFIIPNPSVSLHKALGEQAKANASKDQKTKKADESSDSESDEAVQPPVKKTKENKENKENKDVSKEAKETKDGKDIKDNKENKPRFAAKENRGDESLLNIEEGYHTLAKMKIDTTFNLNSAVISPNGTMVACADALSVKLFALRTQYVKNRIPLHGVAADDPSNFRETVQISRLAFPPVSMPSGEPSEAFLDAQRVLAQSGSHCVTFSPDNSILAVAAEDGSVFLVDLILGQLVAAVKGSKARSFLPELGLELSSNVLANTLTSKKAKIASDDSDSEKESEKESEDESEASLAGDDLPEDDFPVVRDIKFSACGSYISAMDSSRIIRIFRITTMGRRQMRPRLISTLPALTTPCTAFAFLPIPVMKIPRRLQKPESGAVKSVPAKKTAASLFSKASPMVAKSNSINSNAELIATSEMVTKFSASLVHPPLVGALANGTIFIYDTNRRVFVEAASRVGDAASHHISIPFPAYTTHTGNTGNMQNNISDRVYGNPHSLRDSYVPPTNIVLEKDKISHISVSYCRRHVHENGLGDCVSLLLQSPSIAFHLDIPVSLFFPDHLITVEKMVSSASVSSSMSTGSISTTSNTHNKRKLPLGSNNRVKMNTRPYVVFKSLAQFKPLLFASHVLPSAASVRTQRHNSKLISAPLPTLAFVEVSWLAVLKSLPAALKRKKFGAN